MHTLPLGNADITLNAKTWVFKLHVNLSTINNTIETMPTVGRALRNTCRILYENRRS
jgi:hypothetical protein